MKQGMATTLVEDSPGKVAPPSKKKQKDKSSAGSSLKGSLPNSLLGSSGTSSNSSSGGVARMDVSELPSFTQNDCSLSSTSGSDGKSLHHSGNEQFLHKVLEQAEKRL